MPNPALEQLKKQISVIEQNSLTTESIASQNSFPWENIHAGTLLEIQPESYKQRSAATGVSLALGARFLQERTGPLIWCQLRDPERLHLHAPGLMAFGLNPDRMIKLTIKSEQDLLWAMEEALTCSYISGVVGVLWNERMYDFTASRRLLLRAKENGVSALMVRSHRANGTTAADIRFEVSTQTSSEMRPRDKFLPRIGNTTWQLELKKGKGLKQKRWQIGWNRETLSFDLVSEFSGRVPLPENTEHQQQHVI